MPIGSPNISQLLGPAPPEIPPTPIGTALNPEIHRDKAGFFSSMLSAGTKEQIGILPDPAVQRYRTEHPVRGFTSQVIPEIALFSLPATRVGALAVRSMRPAASLIRYGSKATAEGRYFMGGAAKAAGSMLPILAARQVGSAFASEEGSVQRIAARNAMDLVLGGAFAGTAEFLGATRGARWKQLQPANIEPERSIGTVAKYFEGIDLNNPYQDQFAHFLRLADDPKNAQHPVLPDINKAVGMLRDAVWRQEPAPRRPYVRSLGARKTNSVINKYFKQGAKLPDLPPTFNWQSALPRHFEGFSQFIRGMEVSGPANKQAVWDEFTEKLVQVDDTTFLAQEADEGLYVVAKNVFSSKGKSRRGTKGLFEKAPDQWIILKTSKPHEFVSGGRNGLSLQDIFVHDPSFKRVSENAFLESKFLKPRGKRIEIAPRVEADVLPGNTPTDDAAAKLIDLIDPWQKGMIAASEVAGKIETPSFFQRLLDKAESTYPSWVPRSNGTIGSVQVAKELSTEAGQMIREGGRVSRRVLAPASTGAQFRFSPRAQALNRITSASFHRMMANVRRTIWGDLDDEAIAKGVMKNLIGRLHDPRIGGIGTRIVQTLSTPEKIKEFAPLYRNMLSIDEAIKKGISSDVIDLARALNAHDTAQWMELKATRAALGLEDDFIPLEHYYSMTRMWEGHHRVELIDAVTGDVVGYAGGHSPKQAIQKAREIAEVINKEAGEVQLRDPLPEHLSTTSYIRYSKEMARDAEKLAREVDAFQRGGKLSANNFLTQKIIDTTKKLSMGEPNRFKERAGFLGFRGQFQDLTVDEILETVIANTIETQRLITKESLVTRLQPQLAKLAAEHPDGLDQFITRFNSHLGYQGPIAKEIDRVIDVAMAPLFGSNAASRAVRAMNRGMFNLTFGAGDIGFLGVQALTGFQTLLPEAAMMMTAPPNRLASWYSLYMTNTARGTRPMAMLDPARMVMQGFNELRKLTRESDSALFEAVKRAREEGIVNKPVINELREYSEAAAEGMKAKNPVEAVMRFTEGLIGRTEEFSRLWSFVVGRKIAKEFLNQTEEQAFETARTFVSRTMYEYAAGDRARVLTGAVGSGWGLFKNWTFNYAANLLGYADEALFKGNWAPLAWTMIGTGSVGGAVAMPGYGAANAFMNWATNQDLTEWTYEMAGYGGTPGKLAADGFNYGLLSALGVTLQGRASAPGSQVLRDSTLLLNMAAADRAVGLYRFFGAALDQFGDGNMLALNDKRVQRGLVQAIAPRTMQRAYTYWSGEGLDSLKTGNRLVNKISSPDMFLHSIGLTPMEVERTFDTAAELYKDAETLRNNIAYYGESYAQAWAAQDYQGMVHVRRRAMVEGLPIPSIERSAMARIQKDQDDLLERQFDELLVRRAKMLRGY